MLKEGNLIHFVDSIVSNAGQIILKYLEDPDVKDVMRQSNGTLTIDKIGEGIVEVGNMPEVDAESFLQAIAAYKGVELSAYKAKLEGNLPKRPPFRGERIQAMIPPISPDGVTFTIRKKSLLKLTMNDWIEQGSLTPGQALQIDNAIISETPKNILIIGGTGTGKTTFFNSILQRVIELQPKTRFMIIEDTPEVENPNPNLSCSLQTDEDSEVGMNELLAMTLRSAPHRIGVGEIRREEAMTFLDAANTGHPGCIATIHANSAMEGLRRLETILQTHGYNPNPQQIADTIGFLIFIKRGIGRPKVEECAVIQGYNEKNKAYITVKVG